MQSMLEAALAYAKLGYRVFPLAPGSKLPIKDSKGFYDGTTDLATITKWWTEMPNANIGIWTLGMCVLDIDGADNPWLSDAERMRELVTRPMANTPRDGLHVYTLQPDGRHWNKTESDLAPKIDTRGDDGYIIAAPSVGPNGKRYSWVGSHALDMPLADLPEPPEWLTAAMDEFFARTVKPKNPLLSEDVEPVLKGRRKSLLASVAGSLRRIGLSEAAMFGALQVINQERCKPPVVRSKVAGIAESYAKYPPDQMSKIMADGGLAFDDGDDSNDPSDPGDLPLDLTSPPGLMGDIITYTLSTSIYQQPVLSLAGALALMATITGHKIQDRRHLQTNIYTIGVSRAGHGKEYPRRVNKTICDYAGHAELLGSEEFASSSGIISAVDLERVVLFQLDELGKLMRTLNDPKMSHLYNILATLMKLYSSSGGMFIGPAYADTKKVKRIRWPHACVYGTTTPITFWQALTRESIEDGFLARMLVFETPRQRPPERLVDQIGPPEHVLAGVRAWRDFTPGGNLASEFPQPVTLVYTTAADAVFADLSRKCQDEQDRSEAKTESLWTRTAENARKCAMIYAASASGIDVGEVGEDAAVWASRMCLHLTQRLVWAATEHLAETMLESRIKRILKAIIGSGRDGLTKAQITKRFSYIAKREREEIIETLMEIGSIVNLLRPAGKRGPQAMAYVAREHATIADTLMNGGSQNGAK